MADTMEKTASKDEVPIEEESAGGFLVQIIEEIITSPLHLTLVVLIIFLIYKIMRNNNPAKTYTPPEPKLPKIRKDFTAEELKYYDGTQPDGRILVAVNGYVFDVTKGKRFYGPGGPYAAFGGKDASRGLATFSVSANTDGYDDLSDLTPMEMDGVREWEAQFREKYDLVGKFLKPGEQPTNYSDEEEDTTKEDTTTTAAEKKED